MRLTENGRVIWGGGLLPAGRQTNKQEINRWLQSFFETRLKCYKQIYTS